MPTDHTSVEFAILAVMKDVPYIQKAKSSGLKYTYLSEEDLIEKLHAAFVEHGLVIAPIELRNRSSEEYKTKDGKPMNRVSVEIYYRIHHAHSKTHTEPFLGIGEAADVGDKATGKACTMAMKYALRQRFLIMTGDDPDRTPSDHMERGRDDDRRDDGRGRGDDRDREDDRRRDERKKDSGRSSFEKCIAALRGCDSIPLLQRYRDAYLEMSIYSPKMIDDCEVEYWKRMDHLKGSAKKDAPRADGPVDGGRDSGPDVDPADDVPF